jgi:PAS domain S-box-containing protein
LNALVVDAGGDRRAALEAELARQGYAVAPATTAVEALEAVARAEPVLVLVARRLGAEDGLALCRSLDGAPGAENRVVVLVGEPADLSVLDALDAGAADVWALAPGEPAARLREAIAEHYARLQAEHLRLGGEFALLRQALDRTGTGFVMTDPRLDDDPIVYANQAFYEQTGYAPADVLGRNCRMLQGPLTDPADVARIRAALARDRPVTVELVNYRKDGTTFANEVHISPVHDERGQVVRRVSVQVDVTAFRERERLFATEQTARAAAEASGRRSAFLADASPRLDASLDLRETLDSLTRLSVPYLGEVCIVDEVDRGEVHRLAAAAADERVEALVRALPARYPTEPGDRDPLARVIRSGRAEILGRDDPPALGPAAGSGGGGGLATGAPQAAMIVPLRARGRIIGALAFLSLAAERQYTDEDLALAEELARRAALALDNARLYERQSEIASALQAGLVPGRLPEVEGVELAARFRPAGDGSVIGGDFYDVIEREGGFDVVVGDVTGKGARAAALTGLARHTIRTAARYEARPSGVLAVANDALVAERASSGRYCTVAYARVQVRPEGGLHVAVSVGGHPLPIALRADGRAELIGRPGSILGWVDDPTLHDVDAVLAPGEALVLYTDGVSEARTPDGMLGDERLAAVLESAAGMPAGAIASRLERAALQGGNAHDDVALVVLRGTVAGSVAAAA